jgi:hypothetical protein
MLNLFPSFKKYKIGVILLIQKTVKHKPDEHQRTIPGKRKKTIRVL